jgi:hypothetical protein
MGGNLFAHNMETESMEDWTKQADIDADQRCPDECMTPGCKRKATEAFTLYFYVKWLEDENGNRVRRLHGTPWWFTCQGCGESMSFEDLKSPSYEGIVQRIRNTLHLGV